ncbi:MAG: DegT/DnrJ/EryC1/StrS family aminotransferase [bacterium]|nr:DegT/DnrJ/EryC1/StrS family aminotransferase [bacterium]
MPRKKVLISPENLDLKQLELPTDQDASGRSLGEEEVELLIGAVQSGVLTATKGSYVRSLERGFAGRLGVEFATACSSGTAAIHAAVAAVDPEPGDEIISSPITDMGAIAPILYQGAVPVFADVEPTGLTVTASSIEACISERTRAIIVTHLFGKPCAMREILELARARRVPVIEDCAQAYLAESGGRIVGTLGAIGCFSLQQGKHITTGEGGLVVTNDEALGRRIRLFVNKGWDYGGPQPDHGFLALNYRMSELQGAVGVAQLAKLDSVTESRIASAKRLSELLSKNKGLETPAEEPAATHSYWRYLLGVNGDRIPGGAPALAEELGRRGVSSSPNYIGRPAFQCGLFRDQKTFGQSRFPFSLARPEATDYSPERYPGTFEGLARALVLPWNERLGAEHVDHIGRSIQEAISMLGKDSE